MPIISRNSLLVAHAPDIAASLWNTDAAMTRTRVCYVMPEAGGPAHSCRSGALIR